MDALEREIREKIEKEISYDLKILLENCAHLGLDAVRPRETCDNTYVEGAHEGLINKIRGNGA